ncbi:MAG: YicC/YloC family endoribonuclease [Candidatus Aminicenantes bacterium]|jgi:uncharacterized protein (TIGR00255 family)
MIFSMTGFAEKTWESKSLSVKVTIRTLNHRFFDWNYRGYPVKDLEQRMRATCQKKIRRGRIEVAFEVQFADPSKWDIQINEGLLSNILNSLDNVSAKISKDVSFHVENLFSLPHVFELKRKDFTEEESRFLMRCFEMTLDDLLRSRSREGRELKKELRSHIRNIGQILLRLSKLAKIQPFHIQEKMKERLTALKGEVALPEDRVLEEAAIIAQRYDLQEEIERLKCHLNYFRELLSTKEKEPLGRKMDFTIQEMYREVNTINSKSQDIAITQECLRLKSELETLRQQVQNIE